MTPGTTAKQRPIRGPHPGANWDVNQIAETFGALSHPARVEIVLAMSTGERSVGDLINAVGLSQPVTSQHLKVLRDRNIVTVRSAGNRRLYRLAPEPTRQLRALLDQVWPAGLANLKQVAEANHAATTTGTDVNHHHEPQQEQKQERGRRRKR